LPVHQIPEFKWKDTGTAIVNVIPLPKDDSIVAVIPVKDFNTDQSLVFVTKRGQVKRTELKEYATTRSTAIAACKVAAGDEVIEVKVSDSSKQIMLVTASGMSIRFYETEVNAMGRAAGGVKGIQLREDDEIIAALWVENDEGEVLVVSDTGHGKRTLLLDYPIQGRGGKGVQTFEFKEGKRVRSNGQRLLSAFYCREPIELAGFTDKGLMQIVQSEKTIIEERKSTGRTIFQLEKEEQLLILFSVTDRIQQPKAEN